MAKVKIIKEAQFEEAIDDFKNAHNALTVTQAEKALKVTNVVRPYEKKEREALEKKERAQAIITAYVEQNRDNLLTGEKKSTTMSGVRFGFRMGKPKLTSEDWDKAFDQVKEMLPEFIKVSETLDKVAIIGKAEELKDKLDQIGIRVEQEEAFFIEI